MWGQGIYFAKNADYSNSYAFVSSSGDRVIFLAQVICGQSKHCESDATLKLPPPLPQQSGQFAVERYDSVNGVTKGTQVYTIYDNNRAYPKYLITYRMDDASSQSYAPSSANIRAQYNFQPATPLPPTRIQRGITQTQSQTHGLKSALQSTIPPASISNTTNFQAPAPTNSQNTPVTIPNLYTQSNFLAPVPTNFQPTNFRNPPVTISPTKSEKNCTIQ